ncbi:DUF169 domain-containing protein [Methanothermobacter wolfeii]|uniref:DUF169 domain-containing protein n=1 Tax=Methanothermobacter wolfeii TaxID=145261 RepID=A0A9E7RVV5_METWO|nr:MULTISPECIES: DUF169 domain-containing protein [Methanothermobacter]NLM02267.1 DUF169 domain-containing protein [Methanothermobacter wolfeii]QHN06165.1 hypothetical protein FZP57_03195 [Methanothermobacter sp. THM-1]UXH32367.1 DUF169 domain-containing protein [Methanothermobacter wolfeii]SCM56724.1 putative protein {ECO:0000313/EMBL:AFV24952,1} [Methanothermobacter wolfeii]
MKETAKKLKEILNLNGVVGVTLIKDEKYVPDGIETLENPLFYCVMLKKAASERKSFYAPAEVQSCPRGKAVLGMGDTPEFEKTGEFYINKSSAADTRAATRLVESVPRLKDVKGTLIQPLEDAKNPDVVLAFPTNARNAHELIHASIYQTGGSINAEFAAPYSFCGYTTARTYLNDEVSFAIPCGAAKKAVKMIGEEYTDEELIVTIPGQQINQVAENLTKLGSVKERMKAKTGE